MGSPLKGERPVGRLERLSRERHLRDLDLAYGGRIPKTAREARSTTKHPKGFWYDPEAAEFVVAWIEKYGRHHKGEWAGRPLILEEWQRQNHREIYGWKRDDCTRRFREAWWHTPRKQGKTQIAGANGLFLLVGDNEPGAEVYTTATKKDQAAICHEAARQMVRQCPELRAHVKVPKNKLAHLTVDASASFMAILASDHGTLDGLNPHGDIRDEIAEWKNRELAEVLDTAKASRRQPLAFEITTAGVYDEEAIGWEHQDRAVHVLEGTFEDDSLWAFVTAIEEDDDPFDPSVWWKACPNLGVSMKLSYIEDEARKAQNQPSRQNAFLQKLLNRWTQQITRWLAVQQWSACYRPDFKEEALYGRECFGGLDLSSTTDLAAFVLVFISPDGSFDVVPRFYLPEDTIAAAEKEGRRYYRQWQKEGKLIATPGNVIDYDFIRADVNALSKVVKIKEIGYDPYNATQMSNNLQADGFSLVKVQQGFLTLNEPSKLLERAVMSGRFRHGSPVLKWNGLNVAVVTDPAGNIKPTKPPHNRPKKIDGISATVDALSRIVGAEPPKGPETSYLSTSPLLVLS